MKRSVIGILTVAGLAGAANAQSYEIVTDRDTVNLADAGDDGLVAFSLFFDTNGSTAGFFGSFFGWSQYAGIFESEAGVFQLTGDTGTYTDVQVAPGFFIAFSDENWMGRRAPATGPAGYDGASGASGGSNGGFRAFPQPYEANGSQLTGLGGGSLAGLQRSTPLGGTGQNEDPRLEVFRGVVDYSAAAAGDYDLSFIPELLQIFIDADHNLERAVLSDMDSLAQTIHVIVPAPASMALLGLGGLVTTRRRR